MILTVFRKREYGAGTMAAGRRIHLTELSRDITMSDGAPAMVIAYPRSCSCGGCYDAELVFQSGERVPCHFMHQPVGLADALDLAVAYARRTAGAYVLA